MLKFVLIAIATATLFLIGCDNKDQCLDSGGHYNIITSVCEYDYSPQTFPPQQSNYSQKK